MGNAFTVAVRASYVSNVAQGVRQDAGSISHLAASTERAAGKATNATRGLGMASLVAGKLLLVGVGGAMAVSAKAAIEFESSMAEVAKTTDMAGSSFQANSGPLFAFGQALRDMSLRTPVNVNDLAQLAALGGQLGIEIPNLLEFTEVMAALGVTTNLSATEAASGMARFANIMRTPQDEFRRLGNIIVELGNNLATTESEILNFGTRLAPIGRIVGMTEEEVLALAGALTSLGVPAERGGTALQKWFILAKQAVDSGGESLDKFARVAGMTSEMFSDLFRRSPAEAMQAFVKGLDEMNTAGLNVFGMLEGLGLAEVRTTQVLLAMAGGYDIVAESIAMANEQGENGNALFEEAARRYGTTASQIQLLGNSFRDLQIEIGNMLLGSGGLQFAVEAIREFFAIVKENLPNIGRFILLMGVLGAGRLVIGLIANFSNLALQTKEFFTATRLAVTGAGQLTGTMGVMSRAAGLLSIAMNGVLLVAGLVAAAWAWQAVRAAELRAKIRGLFDEVEQGANVFDVFHREISGALSEKSIQRLHEMGLSTQDLTEFLLSGKRSAQEFMDVFGMLPPNFDELTDKQRWEAMSTEILGINDILRESEGVVRAAFGIKKIDLTNALIESGAAAGKSRSEISELVDKALELVGLGISDSEFVTMIRAWTSHWTPDVFIGIGEQIVDGLGTGMDSASGRLPRWQDLVPEEDVESFFEDNMESVEEFTDALEEEFARIGTVIRSGFPVWEEYKQVVLGKDGVLSFKDAIKAQEAFLADTRDFVNRLPDIMRMGASADTVAWLESMEPGIRAAISRLNDAQLQELIDGANANFDALNELHMTRWMQIYPENANLAFAAMIGDLMNRVTDMNLPGAMAGQAFSDGIIESMAALPAQHRTQFLTYITEALSDPAWMAANGFSTGEDWIEGLLRVLRGLAGKIGPVVKGQFDKIKNSVNSDWEIASPSKWWERFGEQWMEGLKRGIRAELGEVAQMVSPASLMPIVSGMSPTSNVTNTRTGNYNLTINTGASGDGISKEAQTMLTILGIVSGVEAGAGR